jgi:carbon-monoxide dehydrogenase medium subunit
MAPTPVRARAAEAALNGSSPNATELTEIARLAVGDTEPTADVHASAEYRQHVGAHLVERALDRALGAARRG